MPNMGQTRVKKGPKPKPLAILSKASGIVGMRKCPLGSKTKNPSEDQTYFNKKLNARKRAAVFVISSSII